MGSAEIVLVILKITARRNFDFVVKAGLVVIVKLGDFVLQWSRGSKQLLQGIISVHTKPKWSYDSPLVTS